MELIGFVEPPTYIHINVTHVNTLHNNSHAKNSQASLYSFTVPKTELAKQHNPV